jgi:hypothetical protein
VLQNVDHENRVKGIIDEWKRRMRIALNWKEIPAVAQSPHFQIEANRYLEVRDLVTQIRAGAASDLKHPSTGRCPQTRQATQVPAANSVPPIEFLLVGKVVDQVGLHQPARPPGKITLGVHHSPAKRASRDFTGL